MHSYCKLQTMECQESYVQVQQKRALVTGGASGIGKAIATALDKAGIEVFVLDSNEDNLALVRRELPNIHTRTVDLRNWERTRHAVQSVLPIHLLVNNAECAEAGPIIDMTKDQIDKAFDINIKAYINITQVVVKHLIENRLPGSIVNISSVSTFVPIPITTSCTASMYTLDGFTKALAAELGPKNIRVNSVNPGLVKTELTKSLWENREALEALLKQTPLRKLVTPEDVAELVVFLLSNKSRMITGTCIPIDGGQAVSFEYKVDLII